jgi:hypothetical protein
VCRELCKLAPLGDTSPACRNGSHASVFAACHPLPCSCCRMWRTAG